MFCFCSGDALALPRVQCPNHPDAILVEDYRAGDMICPECGLVVGQYVLYEHISLLLLNWSAFSDRTHPSIPLQFPVYLFFSQRQIIKFIINTEFFAAHVFLNLFNFYFACEHQLWHIFAFSRVDTVFGKFFDISATVTSFTTIIIAEFEPYKTTSNKTRRQCPYYSGWSTHVTVNSFSLVIGNVLCNLSDMIF